MFKEGDHNFVVVVIIDELSLEIQYTFGDYIPIDVIIIILAGSLFCAKMVEISYVVAGEICAAV